MKDIQETAEQAYKHPESSKNDLSLKNNHEIVDKNSIFLKKMLLNPMYAKTTQHDTLVKTGPNSLNDDDFKQRTLPFNLSNIKKKHNLPETSSKYEDVSKQDSVYNKVLLKEKNSKKNSENAFEVCIREKNSSRFLNFNNNSHNSLLQVGTSIDSQLSISNKNPWRNKLSEFSPPTKRKKASQESHENDDSVIFTGPENPFINSTDTFSNATKKQKILQLNFNQTNTPIPNNTSKDFVKFNQKRNNLDQNNGGVSLLFSGLEKIRREREELEKELNIKNAELLHTNSELLSIKQKTKDIKFKFSEFQKFLDGLARDHNSLHKEIIKWSNEIKLFQTDIIKSRESLQGIINQCEILTNQGKFNSKLHRKLAEVKEELVKQNMYRKNLQEKYSKDADLLAEERDKVRILENQLINEREEKDNQRNKFLKEQEIVEKLFQSFHEETQKNENILKNMFSLWTNEARAIEHNILHEISLNFQVGPNILDPFRKIIQENLEKYSKEYLSVYSDIKSFHSNILSFNKRIENFEKGLKETNILIKDKEKHNYIGKIKDFIELIQPFRLEIEELKLQLGNYETNFKKELYLNESHSDKFLNIQKISEKLKISEKNYEQVSNENIMLKNILEDMKRELKSTKDECDFLKNKLRNLESSNSLFLDSAKNIEDLKKQYEKQIAEHERRSLKLKETEQAKFDNIIKSKDNKINKLEKEVSILKSLNTIDVNNMKENDKIIYKEKLINMIGLEKTELIDKITEQDNAINLLKNEIEKLLNTNCLMDDISKNFQKNKISQSSNRIIYQTSKKMNNISKTTNTTSVYLPSQMISPPNENIIKETYSNSLEHSNTGNNKTKPRFTKNVKDGLQQEAISDKMELLDKDSISDFPKISENLLTPSDSNKSLSLERYDSSLTIPDNDVNIQHEAIVSSQLNLQSSPFLEKNKSIENYNNIHENYTKENIDATFSEYLSIDTTKNTENVPLKKKNQDKQKNLKKLSIEYPNNDSNFWPTAELENSTDQKSYSTRNITNTYKKKKVGKYLY
ncbi:hypothetical protein PNEG_02063 [Pneumocystis murina B123]|uniref:Uncharacterized protein n=1 Tax=Pneumocystis murina (strain B123) TaxID=1069680 RepID=M7NQU2_PNEMU|nr:hypothetical protein PNEG_02063 [Pneumocystis murina B123]EMR09476.1 hypothetical protein PNEG_02063 [Pneumocystis murina B123]